MELTPGKVALCLRTQPGSSNFYVLKEGMTPEDSVKLFKNLMTGAVNMDELTDEEWRVVDLNTIKSRGTTQITLPPVEEWRK